jgi:hypothetical protein
MRDKISFTKVRYIELNQQDGTNICYHRRTLQPVCTPIYTLFNITHHFTFYFHMHIYTLSDHWQYHRTRSLSNKYLVRMFVCTALGVQMAANVQQRRLGAAWCCRHSNANLYLLVCLIWSFNMLRLLIFTMEIWATRTRNVHWT